MLARLWLPCRLVAMVAVSEERRHRRGPEQLWGESWYFDFAAPDGSLGGFVRLGLYPNLGVAWYWAALVGHGRRLVLVRDHEIGLPRGSVLEVRGEGLWSAVNCETPLDHWSIGLEAFAVALDDPAEAYRGERGDLVGLGFDLEWEAVAPAGPVGPAGPAGSAGPAGLVSYAQACRVTGEVLVGDEQLALDGYGHRGHAWGVQDWWGSPRCLASGVLDDGGAFVARTGAGLPPFGCLSGPGLGQEPELIGPDQVRTTAVLGESCLPVSAAITLGEVTLAVTVLAHAPLLLEAPNGRRAQLARALCLYQSPEGRSGVGWADWLQPQPGRSAE